MDSYKETLWLLGRTAHRDKGIVTHQELRKGQTLKALKLNNTTRIICATFCAFFLAQCFTKYELEKD